MIDEHSTTKIKTSAWSQKKKPKKIKQNLANWKCIRNLKLKSSKFLIYKGLIKIEKNENIFKNDELTNEL